MKIKIVQVLSALVLGAVLMGVTSQPGFASTSTAGPSDSQELEAFLDGILTEEMADKHVAGAVVAVVKDGSLLLAKGYGYADLDAQTPVDPERTLFRVGSVSKLFIWTAVMQLLEQGKLSLDTDINAYLDFTIPATFPESITLRHLLSHTPGFEDRGQNMWKLQVEQMSSLDEYLKANLPARVYPPGEVAAYSNYGSALAGYIVERVSGLPFSEYVEQNIFAPLGMEHSTFRQPLPENLAAAMSKGYNYTNEQYIEGSFEFHQSYPAGGMSAPATDMARFMLAHLQNGQLDGQRILQEDTAIQMHSQLYTPDPRLESMAYGFFEGTVNGQRMISHGGDTMLFHSGLYLIPEQNVGIFVSTNSTGGWTVEEDVEKAFFNHYYPAAEQPAPQPSAGFAERIAPYLGQYTQGQSNFTSFEKIFRLFSSVNASLDGENTLVLSTQGKNLRFMEVEPGLLQEIDNPANQWVYRSGAGERLFLMQSGPYPLFRTPWYGTTNLHIPLFLSGTLLFLVALVAWPIGYFVGRRKRSVEAQPNPLPARLAHWAAALFGLLWLVSVLGIVSIFTDILPGFGQPRIIFETPLILSILMLLSYVLGGLALAILVFAVLAWVRSYWSLGGRIFYTLLALLALLMTWALVYWNVLS